MIKETYNLIILDRSGSMISIKNEAVAGVNETIGTIRSIANKQNMPQKLTLTTFCSCTMQDLYQETDIEQVKPIESKDYIPCCCTPLFDAIGRSCTHLLKEIGNRDDVAVSVTIITDGYENASREWDAKAIKKLIEELKAKGWLFAYIGANQDLDTIKYSISIDNVLSFEADAEGTKKMFSKERAARKRWSSFCSSPGFSGFDGLAEINKNYFDEDSDKTGKNDM